LVEDGAYAGEIPYTSDRVYTKQIDYSEIRPGLPQPDSIKRLTGSWLCSWLYKAPWGESIWMDRYYNSSYYTIGQALTASLMVYNRDLYPDATYDVWDEYSKMTLESGVRYLYYRSGQQNSRNFLEYLEEDYQNPLGSKLIDIEVFNSSPLKDISKYKNDGLLLLNKEENLKTDYLVLDGTNHAVFPAKNSLLEQDNFTISLWLKVDDWANINGNQIFGNFYDSGFGFINEASLTAPLLTIVDSTSGNILNLNYRLNKIEELVIPKTENYQENFLIQRLINYTYWIIDAYNRKLRLYGVEGKIIKEVNISGNIDYIDQVEIDSHENLYFYDIKNKKLVKMSQFGVVLNTTTYTDQFKRIEIDLDDQVIGSYGTSSTIDNNNNI